MDLWKLTDRERAYVVARARAFGPTEALELAGMGHSTYYDWPKERRAYLDGLARDGGASAGVGVGKWW